LTSTLSLLQYKSGWGDGVPPGGKRKMFADRDTRFIRVLRDVDFGGVVRIRAGAVRLVTTDDLVGAALFVPCDLANDAAGVIALDPDDYEALEAPVPFDVAIQAF
tara:strand:+ start:143 stop:457 length:315 start_codon:yes stop_codon:yes gene_type:complete